MSETENIRGTFDIYREVLFTYIKFMAKIVYCMG